MWDRAGLILLFRPAPWANRCPDHLQQRKAGRILARSMFTISGISPHDLIFVQIPVSDVGIDTFAAGFAIRP